MRALLLFTLPVLLPACALPPPPCVEAVGRPPMEEPCRSIDAFKRTLRPSSLVAGGYMFDGDILLRGQGDIQDLYANECTPPMRRHGALVGHGARMAAATWSEAEKRNLSYCISDRFNDAPHRQGSGSKEALTKALREAASAWEAAADVRFVHRVAEDAHCDNHSDQVLLDVLPALARPGDRTFAVAPFPDYPRSERTLWIATNRAFSDPVVGLTAILRHELGHVLGFGHEHVRNGDNAADPGCNDDDSATRAVAAWYPVTAYDPLSVMHYPHCAGGSGRWDFALSRLDILGAQTVYGIPEGYSPLAFAVEKGSTRVVEKKQVKLDDALPSTGLERAGLHRITGITAALGSEVVISIGGASSRIEAYGGYEGVSHESGFACKAHVDPAIVRPSHAGRMDAVKTSSCHFKVDGRSRAVEVLLVGDLGATVEVHVEYQEYTRP